MGQSPHVLLISTSYPISFLSYEGVFVQDAAESLDMADIRVGVLVPRLSSLRSISDCIRNTTLGRWLNKSSVSVCHGGLPNFVGRNKMWGLRLLRPLAGHLMDKYCRRFGKPDVLHAHSTILSGMIAYDLSHRFGIPFGVTEHSSGYALGQYDQECLRQASAVVERAVFRIAVSEFQANTLSRLGVGSEWRVIHNPVAPIYFKQEGFVRKASNRCVRFVAVGPFDGNKGQEKMIRSFFEAFKGIPDVVFDLYGNGHRKHICQATIMELGISSQVRIHPPIFDRKVLAQTLCSADVTVIGSNVETFSLIAAESLACGTPVLSTRCGGPEGFICKDVGELVDCSSDGLKAGFMQMYARIMDAGDFSGRIKRHAKSLFSASRYAENMVSFYCDCS